MWSRFSITVGLMFRVVPVISRNESIRSSDIEKNEDEFLPQRSVYPFSNVRRGR